MFEMIEEYIKKSKQDRQKHLQLDVDCIEIGGYDSREYRGLLAHFLKTTIPTRKKIVLCHACNNSQCSNPLHLYWGTYAENNSDITKTKNYKSIWRRLVEKHGVEGARNLLSLRAKKGHLKRTSKQRSEAQVKSKLTDEEIYRRIEIIKQLDVTRYGWIGKAATILGISHPQVRRFCDKHMKFYSFYKRK